jgi:hypothetical protein
MAVLIILTEYNQISHEHLEMKSNHTFFSFHLVSDIKKVKVQFQNKLISFDISKHVDYNVPLKMLRTVN